jgi:hypothetical protein
MNEHPGTDSIQCHPSLTIVILSVIEESLARATEILRWRSG